MKRAKPFQAAPASALELQVLADDLVDLAALADQRDVRGPDASPPGHQPAAPAPPAVAAATEAAARLRISSSTQSRKTAWSRDSEASVVSVGFGDQPPV